MMIRCVCVFLAVAVPALAFGDVPIIPPTLGTGPLHRIGMEILFETAAITVAGGVALHALVKRRWKWREKMTEKEKREFQLRIDEVWPLLEQAWLKRTEGQLSKTFESEEALCVELTLLLSANHELAVRMTGIPFELVCENAILRWNLRIFHDRNKFNAYLFKEDAQDWNAWQGRRRDFGPRLMVYTLFVCVVLGLSSYIACPQSRLFIGCGFVLLGCLSGVRYWRLRRMCLLLVASGIGCILFGIFSFKVALGIIILTPIALSVIVLLSVTCIDVMRALRQRRSSWVKRPQS